MPAEKIVPLAEYVGALEQQRDKTTNILESVKFGLPTGAQELQKLLENVNNTLQQIDQLRGQLGTGVDFSDTSELRALVDVLEFFGINQDGKQVQREGVQDNYQRLRQLRDQIQKNLPSSELPPRPTTQAEAREQSNSLVLELEPLFVRMLDPNEPFTHSELNQAMQKALRIIANAGLDGRVNPQRTAFRVVFLVRDRQVRLGLEEVQQAQAKLQAELSQLRAKTVSPQDVAAALVGLEQTYRDKIDQLNQELGQERSLGQKQRDELNQQIDQLQAQVGQLAREVAEARSAQGGGEPAGTQSSERPNPNDQPNKNQGDQNQSQGSNEAHTSQPGPEAQSNQEWVLLQPDIPDPRLSGLLALGPVVQLRNIIIRMQGGGPGSASEYEEVRRSWNKTFNEVIRTLLKLKTLRTTGEVELALRKVGGTRNPNILKSDLDLAQDLALLAHLYVAVGQKAIGDRFNGRVRTDLPELSSANQTILETMIKAFEAGRLEFTKERQVVATWESEKIELIENTLLLQQEYQDALLEWQLQDASGSSEEADAGWEHVDWSQTGWTRIDFTQAFTDRLSVNPQLLLTMLTNKNLDFLSSLTLDQLLNMSVNGITGEQAIQVVVLFIKLANKNDVAGLIKLKKWLNGEVGGPADRQRQPGQQRPRDQRRPGRGSTPGGSRRSKAGSGTASGGGSAGSTRAEGGQTRDPETDGVWSHEEFIDVMRDVFPKTDIYRISNRHSQGASIATTPQDIFPNFTTSEITPTNISRVVKWYLDHQNDPEALKPFQAWLSQ